MSAGSIEQEPSRKLACCGVPLITEDMQSLAIRTLSGSDINKHYDLIRELGKGTYGKVDLVSHKSTGEASSAPSGQAWPFGQAGLVGSLASHGLGAAGRGGETRLEWRN